MNKKLIALSVVLLFPVSFISSASAASKPITCYKGTAKKVFKSSTGKCPTGWSSKKSVAPNTPTNISGVSFKTQDISSSEVAQIVVALEDLKNPEVNHNAIYNDCLNLNNYNYAICDEKYPHPTVAKIKKYLPLTKKLVDNFCGLNGELLSENLAILQKGDPLSGYDRFREVTMKPLYANLDKIEINHKKSINTSSTDEFLLFFNWGTQVWYTYKSYQSDKNNILNMQAWDNSLKRTEFGISVSTDNYEGLKELTGKTVKLCKSR